MTKTQNFFSHLGFWGMALGSITHLLGGICGAPEAYMVLAEFFRDMGWIIMGLLWLNSGWDAVKALETQKNLNKKDS